MASPKLTAGSLIRCKLPNRKQPRIYEVAAVTASGVTLRLAWAEGETFPVLGVPKTFKRSELQGVTPYSPEAGE